MESEEDPVKEELMNWIGTFKPEIGDDAIVEDFG